MHHWPANGLWSCARSHGEAKLAANTALFAVMLDYLREGWSPEQIAGRLKRAWPDDQSKTVSHETIYTALYAMPRGGLRKHRRLSPAGRSASERGPAGWRRRQRVRDMLRRKLEVADIFRRHGEAWRIANAGHINRVKQRVMKAIEICRTAKLGGHVERCQECEHTRVFYNSCRNRHCPRCQSHSAAAWLAAREAELLCVPYFHLVFRLPMALGRIAYQNKVIVYGLLLKAAAETLTVIAADPKYLGADIGVTAVLHTWGENLHHHPHAHCLVPGGGISPDGKRWIPARLDFFRHACSRVYSDGSFSKGSLRHSMLVNCISSRRSPV